MFVFSLAVRAVAGTLPLDRFLTFTPPFIPMHVLLRRFCLGLSLCLLGWLSAGSLRADEVAEVLARARAFLGSEAALEGVQALRLRGQLEIVGAEPGEAEPAQLEILFQKPDKQRITATDGTKTEVTALDGYDAWQRISDSSDATLWRVTLLGPDQIKRLRANTFENLAFYRNHAVQGARVEDRGAATVDGLACRKLAFVHGPGIVFTRSFELASGRLVLTETESGTQIREEGELRAGGLRFPQRIRTLNRLPDGTSRTLLVTFSGVEVNPDLDPSWFAIPPLNP